MKYHESLIYTHKIQPVPTPTLTHYIQKIPKQLKTFVHVSANPTFFNITNPLQNEY